MPIAESQLACIRRDRCGRERSQQFVVSATYSGGFLAAHALIHAGVHRVGLVQLTAVSRTQIYAAFFTAAIALTLAACAVGPNYSREPATVPTKFKELKGWKMANPSDELDRGDWWTVYRDHALDALLPQVEISNQTVAADAAAYEEARAIIREGQANLFPTATASYSATRTRTGALAGTTGGSAVGAGLGTRYTTQYSAPIIGSWDIDVWGRLRRQVESDTAAAQVSAADLDNAKLSQQAMLATAYFNLRASDSLIVLLQRTIAEYQRTYDIVNNQFKAGFSVTAGDVATADANIRTTEAQLASARASRAQFEHAIAVLIGRPPAELTVAPRGLGGGIPRIPVTLPSALLERRPDIAAAERTMQEQNALIGVNEAAYFPDISLTSMIQFIGPIPLPFSAARSIGSIAASGTQTLFNGGLTAAQVDAARALYWQSVANYRQTVLTAFQQVEDELAAIHYFSQQVSAERLAVADERKAVDVFLNQFQAGTVAFTTVVVAEVALLADEEAELTTRQDLFLATVSLIEALGGGWNMSLLPDQAQLLKGFSLTPKLESSVPLVVELTPTLQSPSNSLAAQSPPIEQDRER
jgi:NodT family efflux transporter outer membrane factor (OMF) lipoprotein